MDCRKSLWLTGGLWVSLVGCTQTTKSVTRPPTPPAASATGIPEKYKPLAELDPQKPIVEQLKPSTTVRMANVHAAIAADPNRPAQQRQMMQEQARTTYQRAIDKDPTYLPAYRGLAQLYIKLGDRAEALAAYEKALKVAPKDGNLWYELGMMHAQGHEWDAAVQCLHKATECDPENRIYRKNMGFTLARAGNFEAGYEWLSRSMPEAQARYTLARMYQHLDRPQECMGQLQLALNADPHNVEVREFWEELRNPQPAQVQPQRPDNAIMQASYQVPAPQQPGR